MQFPYSISAKKWMSIAVVNFLIVGLLGLLMRLKMVLPMPWVQQKFLLHSHSHFAFSGWVTHALMVLMFILIGTSGNHISEKTRKQGTWLILANLIVAYGMLITFAIQGYARFSITFATLSIFISYFFALSLWKQINIWVKQTAKTLVGKWFKAALIFLVFSSLGTFALSYLMATHNIDAQKQLASVYFYLHFQYNGWFLFTCFGLFHHWLSTKGIRFRHANKLFYTFLGAAVPTYFLSVLWWKHMPNWLYILVVLFTIAQLVVWFLWIIEVWKKIADVFKNVRWVIRLLLFVVAAAFSIKLLLQSLSLIPDLSQLAYGFRPIVIAYLHLVLLVVISLFILAYSFLNNNLANNSIARMGIFVIVFGVLVNEVILMVQGLSGIFRVYINYTPQLLVFASAIICLGILSLLIGQKSRFN